MKQTIQNERNILQK